MHFKLLTLISATALLTISAAHAGTLSEDSSAAVVYSYGSISDDDDDSLTPDNFQAQLTELTSGDYTVQPLPQLLRDHALPRRSVALSFDALDYAFIHAIAPQLLEKKLPFTVFVSPGQLDAGGTVTWDDLRNLAGNQLVTLGLTAYSYAHTADWPLEKLTEDLNRAKARFREEFKQEAEFFAYPYGEYTPAYKSLIDQQGFKAAFGQQSGVIYAGADRLALPRFTMTDDVADLDRLRMTSQALPFPVSDLEPASPLLTVNPPFPGFTVAGAITADDLAKMTCFASGIGQLKLQKLGHNRVEIRFPRGFDDTRGRVNCTLPVYGSDDPRDVRWRWLGFLYTVPASLIDPTAEDTRRDEVTPVTP